MRAQQNRMAMLRWRLPQLGEQLAESDQHFVRFRTVDRDHLAVVREQGLNLGTHRRTPSPGARLISLRTTAPEEAEAKHKTR